MEYVSICIIHVVANAQLEGTVLEGTNTMF